MDDDLLNGGVAAQMLSELLAEKTPVQWALWLQNNRNQLRNVSFRVPFIKMAGGVFYRRDDIAKFAELEKSRQLGTIRLTGRAKEALAAFGIGTASGSTTGQKLTVTGISPQVDQASGKSFVQLVVNDPLKVYRLELDQAEGILKELNEAIQFIKRNQT